MSYYNDSNNYPNIDLNAIVEALKSFADVIKAVIDYNNNKTNAKSVESIVDNGLSNNCSVNIDTGTLKINLTQKSSELIEKS